MKKIIALLLALTFVLGMTACGSKKEPEKEEIAGGWTEAGEDALTDEIRGYLEKATAGEDGAKYEAVKLLATQVVAGRNYELLCNVTPIVPNAEPVQKIVKIYVDLEGNCSLTSVEDAAQD